MKQVKNFLHGEVKTAIEEGNLQLAVSKMFSLQSLNNKGITNVLYNYFNIGSIVKDIINWDNLKMNGEIKNIDDIENNTFYLCASFEDEMAVDNLNEKEVWNAWNNICEMV